MLITYIEFYLDLNRSNVYKNRIVSISVSNVLPIRNVIKLQNSMEAVADETLLSPSTAVNIIYVNFRSISNIC